MKKLICVLLLGCSSESTNEAPASLGGAAGTVAGGQAGSVATGGLGGAGAGGVAGAELGGSAGIATGGAGGTTVTPACAAQDAITKPALAKVTWTWQSYSDQKLATNQCIACKNSPCSTTCTVTPASLLWDKPGLFDFYGDSACQALISLGTCGSENTCSMTAAGGIGASATLVPTASGWKLVGVAPRPGQKEVVPTATFAGMCGSIWIDAQALGHALGQGFATSLEGKEFPCP